MVKNQQIVGKSVPNVGKSVGNAMGWVSRPNDTTNRIHWMYDEDDDNDDDEAYDYEGICCFLVCVEVI